jgi:hypothetical protein
MVRVPQATRNMITNKGRTNRRYCSFALRDFFKMISCFVVIEFLVLVSWINFAAPNRLRQRFGGRTKERNGNFLDEIQPG